MVRGLVTFRFMIGGLLHGKKDDSEKKTWGRTTLSIRKLDPKEWEKNTQKGHRGKKD